MIEKFKRKPQEVEAIQVLPENKEEIINFIGKNNIYNKSGDYDSRSNFFWIQFYIDNNIITAYFEDWIIKDRDGNFSHLSDVEFLKKFEEVY
jgi:hypothetical protein